MVRSRGKTVDFQEEYDNISEAQEPVAPKEKEKKSWEYTEARRASLQKAREKAKQLREQLKATRSTATPEALAENKEKNRKPTKLEQKIEQVSKQSEDAPVENSTPKSQLIRQGKFVYLT